MGYDVRLGAETASTVSASAPAWEPRLGRSTASEVDSARGRTCGTKAKDKVESGGHQSGLESLGCRLALTQNTRTVDVLSLKG